MENFTFYERVYKLAINKSGSVAQMEKDLDMAVHATQKWKTSMPSAKYLIKLADYFDCSVDYLLGRYSNMDDQKATLCAKFDRLSASQRSDALRYMDFLLSQNPVKKESEIG